MSYEGLEALAENSKNPENSKFSKKKLSLDHENLQKISKNKKPAESKLKAAFSSQRTVKESGFGFPLSKLDELRDKIRSLPKNKASFQKTLSTSKTNLKVDEPLKSSGKITVK